MSVVWSKIRRDLGQNKARAALVVLSIGMMRATGATSPVVAGIFIFEGVLIGVLRINVYATQFYHFNMRRRLKR